MMGRVRNWGWWMGGLLLVALLFFEMFNYSTTLFALTDLLGDLKFLGLRWAAWLAVAFCSIDLAGLVRLFALPGDEDAAEVWYLFGAWLLAASMNALLTWWGVSVALLTHEPVGTRLLGRETLLTVVPIFVAVLVWLTRILLIGTLTVAGPQLLEAYRGVLTRRRSTPARGATSTRPRPARLKGSTGEPRGVGTSPISTPEPTYEPVQVRGAGSQAKRLV